MTWPSAMDSSRADWVLGEARLISSARTMLLNTGPGRNSKALRLPVPDGDAHDVGGQEVGGELDAAERAVDRRGEGLGQAGLADAGHVLDEEVPLGDQAEQRELDDLGLALDHLLDVADDLLK